MTTKAKKELLAQLVERERLLVHESEQVLDGFKLIGDATSLEEKLRLLRNLYGQVDILSTVAGLLALPANDRSELYETAEIPKESRENLERLVVTGTKTPGLPILMQKVFDVEVAPIKGQEFSFKELTSRCPTAPKVLTLLSRIPGGITRVDLDAVLKEAIRRSRSRNDPLRPLEDDLSRSIELLQELHLVEFDGHGRMRTTVPVRSIAARKLQEMKLPRAVMRRLDRALAVHLTGILKSMGPRVGSEDGAALFVEYQREEQNITAVLGRLTTKATDSVFVELVKVWSPVALYYHSSREDLLFVLERAVSRTKDAHSQSRLLFEIGRWKTLRDDLDGAQAAFQAALPIFREIPDHPGEANTLKFLGDIESRLYNLNEAEESYQTALTIYEETQDRLGEANTLLAYANLKILKDDLDGAEESFQAALLIFRATPRRLGEANTLLALANLKMRTDSLDGAEETYQAALLIFRKIRERLGEANTLRALGDLKRRTGDLDGAKESYQTALPIFREIRKRLGEAATLRSLGDLKMRTDDLDGANESYQTALSIYREIRSGLGEANALRALGDLKMHLGDLTKAGEIFQTALPIYRKIGHRLGEAYTLLALGNLEFSSNNLDGAGKLYRTALPIFREIQDRLGEGNLIQSLANLSMASGKPEEAEKGYVSAFELHQSTGDRLGMAADLIYLGRLHLQRGRPGSAVLLFEDALYLQRASQNLSGEVLMLTDQAGAFLTLGLAGGAAAALTIAAAAGERIGMSRPKILLEKLLEQMESQKNAEVLQSLRKELEHDPERLRKASVNAIAAKHQDASSEDEEV